MCWRLPTENFVLKIFLNKNKNVLANVATLGQNNCEIMSTLQDLSVAQVSSNMRALIHILSGMWV